MPKTQPYVITDYITYIAIFRDAYTVKYPDRKGTARRFYIAISLFLLVLSKIIYPVKQADK